MFRVELDGLLETGDGFIHLPLPPKGDADGVVKGSIFRDEFNCLPEAGDRSLVVLLTVTEDNAEGMVGAGIVGPEVNGLLVAGDGLVQLVLALQGIAEAAAGSDVSRVEFE